VAGYQDEKYRNKKGQPGSFHCCFALLPVFVTHFMNTPPHQKNTESQKEQVFQNR
jgi:hypothetical protein